MTLLVGGVAQLYQGDLDLGRLAVERLSAEDLGPGVLVEELSYGGVAVAQRLDELRPSALVLVGAAERDREPGTVERRRVEGPSLPPEDASVAIGDAVVGYVTVDLVLEVADGLGALPERAVTIDVEPASTDPGEGLSPEAEAGLEQALELVRAEARRAPLLELAGRVREAMEAERLESCGAVVAVRRLLGELELLDREGRFGEAFDLRDRLRREISAGHTPEGMIGLDWGLWWALVEELDRLQPLEVGWIRTESSSNGGGAGSSSSPRF